MNRALFSERASRREAGETRGRCWLGRGRADRREAARRASRLRAHPRTGPNTPRARYATGSPPQDQRQRCRRRQRGARRLDAGNWSGPRRDRTRVTPADMQTLAASTNTTAAPPRSGGGARRRRDTGRTTARDEGCARPEGVAAGDDQDRRRPADRQVEAREQTRRQKHRQYQEASQHRSHKNRRAEAPRRSRRGRPPRESDEMPGLGAPPTAPHPDGGGS